MASADKVIVVITAEPTSFIDAYGLIKTAFLDYKMENFGVIVNMAHSQIQAKLNFDKFRAITQKFLDVNLKYIGGKYLLHKELEIQLFPENQSCQEIQIKILMYNCIF